MTVHSRLETTFKYQQLQEFLSLQFLQGALIHPFLQLLPSNCFGRKLFGILILISLHDKTKYKNALCVLWFDLLGNVMDRASLCKI